MAAADSLNIKIGVDAPGVPAALRTIGGEIGKIGTQAAAAAPSALKFGAAVVGWQTGMNAAVAATRAVLTAIPALAAELDNLGDKAAAVGSTASALDQMAGTLKLLGVEGVDAATVIGTLDKNLGLAALGMGKARVALDAIGLSVKSFAGLDATERIALVADWLKEVDNEAVRTAISTRILGDAGLKMGALWRQGGDAVRDAAAKVKAAGVVSDQAAEDAGRFQDATDLLGRSLRTLRMDALAPLLPSLTSIVEHLGDVVQSIRGGGGVLSAFDAITPTILGVATAVEVAVIRVSDMGDRFRSLGVGLALWTAGQYGPAAAALIDFASVTEDTEERIEAAYVRLGNRIASLGQDGGPARGAFTPGLARGAAARAGGVSLGSGAGLMTIEDDALLGSAVGEIQITDEYADQSAERSAILRRTMEEQEQIEADSLDRRLDAIGSFAASAGDLFGLITDAVEGGAKKQTRAQVAALKAMFVAQKIAALASIAVNTAQAIMASASVGLPAAIPGMIAAGVAGGVATAVVVGETVSGLVAGEGVGRRNKEPGHRTLPVYLRADEAVLPPQATADAYRLSDAIGVAADRAERSERSSGGDTQVAVYLDGERISGGVERVLVGRLRRGHVELARAVQGVRL